MDASQTSAPVKDQPHTFQPSTEVPGSFPKSAALVSALQGPNDSIAGQPGADKCALCGSPLGAQIHIKGQTEADAESPKWG